jgi:hypothetical protein
LLIYQRLETWNWNLPYVAGGLADQNPTLLVCIDIIARAKAEFEKEESNKREKEMKGRGRGASSKHKVAGRRH